VESGNGFRNAGGRAICVQREPTSNSCARPDQEDAVGPTDRAVHNAPGFR
jgi:hypothetical protein